MANPTTSAPPIGATEQCIACTASAYIRAILKSGNDAFFCRLHSQAKSAKIKEQSIAIFDQNGALQWTSELAASRGR